MSLHKFSYRIMKSTWGIAIDMTAEVTSMSNYSDQNSCKKISNGLWSKILNNLIQSEEEDFIWYGLRLVSESIIKKSPHKTDTLILFHNIEYNPCDYQAEGLTAATIEWVSNALSIDVPKINVVFNKQLSKYEFEYLDI